MIKKRSLLLVALVLFSVSLFAAPVVVTWEWMLEDPNVTTFRYQLDGEDPDGWIVVDSSVTSYTVKGLDGSKAYTLYLQQSYDGENFSGSAEAISEPIFPPEPEVVISDAEPIAKEVPAPLVSEDVAVVADAEPMTEEVTEPVAEEVAEPVADEKVAEPVTAEIAEPVVDEKVAEPVKAEPMVAEAAPMAVVEAPVAEEKAASRFKTTITLGGGVSYAYDAISDSSLALQNINLKAELGLQFKNMMTFSDTFGLGLDVGIAYTPYLANSRGWLDAAKNIFGDFSGVWADFTQAGTLSVAPMLNMQLGKVAIDLGGGGFFTYGPDFKSPKNPSYNYMYGAFAKLGLAYQFNSWFSMGLDVKYNWVLLDFSDIRKFAEAGLYMGFSF